MSKKSTTFLARSLFYNILIISVLCCFVLYKPLYFCYLAKEAHLIVDTFVSVKTKSNPNINFKLMYREQSINRKALNIASY